MGIGGRASYNGITFTDADRRVCAGENGSAELLPAPKWQRAARKKLSRIPLLRGLTLFLQPVMGLVLAALVFSRGRRERRWVRVARQGLLEARKIGDRAIDRQWPAASLRGSPRSPR